MPPSIIFSMICAEPLAGPMVQTILVLRMGFSFF
jgi:hypothetical protein